MQDALIAHLPGLDISRRSAVGVRIVGPRRGDGGSDTKRLLLRMGLIGTESKDRFIPDEYMLASVDDRLALMRGLSDSDGHVAAIGTVEFATTSARLANQFTSLARSLGAITSCRWRTTKFTDKFGARVPGLPSARIFARFPADIVPVSSAKHLAKWRPRHNHCGARFIESVTPDGEADCVCITVGAPDGLYLTRDFLPTHNSSLALNFVANAAAGGRQALVFSLEMTAESIARSMLSAASGVSGDRMRKGKEYIGAPGLEAVLAASASLGSMGVWVNDSCSANVSTIRAEAMRRKAKDGLDLVVVDYLQLMEGRKSSSREQDVSEISRGLKIMAKDLGVPVIALSQLNRMVEQREGHRPKLADLRESGSIEQDADVVLMAYRPWMYSRNELERDMAEIIVAKNRHGPTGTTHLTFNADVVRFSNPTRGAMV